METSKDTNVSRLEELTKSDFENRERNSNQEETHEVGDHKGSSSVSDVETWKSPNVSESYGGSDGGHVKGESVCEGRCNE